MIAPTMTFKRFGTQAMKRQNIVQIVILLIAIIMVLVATFCLPSSDLSNNTSTELGVGTILLSIGCSIIAVVIINFVEYQITISEVTTIKIINNWKLVSIFSTRQEMNTATNALLDKATEIDISAFGCKGLINYQGDILKKRLKNGLKIRFLVPDKESDFIKQREIDEDAVGGEIKNTIEKLIEWVEVTKRDMNLGRNQILIKQYSCLPMDSIMRIDGNLFTGPFMIKKVSQLTMAYQYKKGGEGYKYYSDYFNSIWNNDDISTPI